MKKRNTWCALIYFYLFYFYFDIGNTGTNTTLRKRTARHRDSHLQSSAHGTAPLHHRHQGNSTRHLVTFFYITMTGGTRQLVATATAPRLWLIPPSVTRTLLVKVQLFTRLTVLPRILENEWSLFAQHDRKLKGHRSAHEGLPRIKTTSSRFAYINMQQTVATQPSWYQ